MEDVRYEVRALEEQMERNKEREGREQLTNLFIHLCLTGVCNFGYVPLG